METRITWNSKFGIYRDEIMRNIEIGIDKVYSGEYDELTFTKRLKNGKKVINKIWREMDEYGVMHVKHIRKVIE